jgi:cytochrome oxidase Cu insertion factor (SCO1/SenC/PrrC family)
MRRLFSGLIVLGLGVAVSATAAPPDKEVEPDRKSATPKPDLHLKQPEVLKQQAPELGKVPVWIGKKGKTNKELAGKVVLVHFWSSASTSSLNNLVSFAEWRKLFKDDGLEIIAVHTCDLGQPFPYHPRDEGQPVPKEDDAELKKLVEKIKKVASVNPAVVETGIDTDGELKRTWGVRRTPTFFLIDKKGKLRYCYEGFLEYQKLHNEEVMREKLEGLLKEEK